MKIIERVMMKWENIIKMASDLGNRIYELLEIDFAIAVQIALLDDGRN